MKTRDMSQEYNGWTNWDTWSTHLWLTNDEGIYNLSKSLVDEYKDKQATLIECLITLAKTTVQDEVNFDRINWLEIVNALKE